MLYDLGSVCTDVQVNAELVVEAELEVGDPEADMVVFVDVDLKVDPGGPLMVEVVAEDEAREHATVRPSEVVHDV